MSTPDLGAEREIDLSGWRTALVERWWIVAAGLVAGIVIGAIYGLSGGSTSEASVLIAPGQPFSPNGSPVLTYQSSPRAIAELVTSESALKLAAKAAGIGVGALRGHVSAQSVSTGASSSTASRGATLIKITVQLAKPKHAEAAANALGALVIESTTSPYVKSSIQSYNTKIAGYQVQQNELQKRIDAYNKTLESPGIAGIDRLTLVNQESNAEQLLATVDNDLSTTQQQLTLAKNVEIASLVGPKASAVKSTARSRRNSIVFGALIGLIVGAIVAIVVGVRASRARGA